jgi:alpha-L-fucosidase
MSRIGLVAATGLLLFAVPPQCRASDLDSGAAERWKRYSDRKFGMFIHWGPYSLASVEASWPIMEPGNWHISEAEYRALPQRFNPVEFDPDAWVRLARDAGMRYMVFTTKHHDGFCMFDSSFTRYKITNTPYKKDIVAMLATAAREHEMPLGFYYSPPDMNHPGYRDTSKLASTNWKGEPERAEWAIYIDYMDMQVRELLTRYGNVEVMWFDGGDSPMWDGYRIHRTIRSLQPQTLINNRLGLPGDFGTPEQFVPKVIPSKDADLESGKKAAGEGFRPWETCMTINETWAYNKNDTKYKSSQQLIRTLVDVASKGGNLLLNVGPTPQGTIQPEFQERLLAIGKWLEVNGDAIYGTTYGPLQDLSWGRTTAKGKTVYLHVFDWPNARTKLPGLKGNVAKVTLLAGKKPVAYSQSGTELTLDLAGPAPDPNASVLAIEMR